MHYSGFRCAGVPPPGGLSSTSGGWPGPVHRRSTAFLPICGLKWFYGLFADLDPPQNFALRSDESSVNDRQMVWRSGRALQAKPARAHNWICKAASSCCATPTPLLDRPSSRRARERQWFYGLFADLDPPQNFALRLARSRPSFRMRMRWANSTRATSRASS